MTSDEIIEGVKLLCLNKKSEVYSTTQSKGRVSGKGVALGCVLMCDEVLMYIQEQEKKKSNV